ncbi:MAG: SIS domain-containing protein [Bacilli bacterium]|nr:SIS domain-containing protein [Bacilli bacterium]
MKESTLKIIDNLMIKQPKMVYLKTSIIDFVNLAIDTYSSKNKILLCGNGGSCSDCEHFSGELNKSFIAKRTIPDGLIADIRKQFPNDADDYYKNLQQAVSCIPLPSFSSFNTAYNNDNDPQFAYAQLLYSIGRENDILVCFSTSGNSKNILNAAKIAKVLGIKVVAFTNFIGGELKEYSDILFNVPTDKTYIAQEFHLMIYHVLCLSIENELFV